MPTRASDRVTLAVLPAPSYVRTYYLLQTSTASAPAVPTTNPPAAPWSTTEPTYTAGSTTTLYTTQLVAYGTAAFEYGPVQVSSAFEAAKQAYNLANTANVAQAAIARPLHGTAVPTANSPTAPEGAVYYRHVTNVQGAVIGQYSRVSGAWVETPLRSEAIANLDVGKMTVGTAEMLLAVAQHIAGRTAAFQQVDVKNLFVTVGATMPEAVITKLFTDVVVGKTLTATEAFIGASAVIDGAIKAQHLDVQTLNGLLITGMLLRSAASGRRIEIRENRLDVYDVNGDLAGSIMGSDESGANGGIITIGRVAGPNNSAGLYTVKIGQQHLPAGGSIGFEVIGAHIEELYLNQAPKDYATGQALEPVLSGYEKGTTTAPNGWSALNTSPTVGTNLLNDGYTYGAGQINVPRPGVYEVTATVAFAGSSAGNLRAVAIGADGNGVTNASPRTDLRSGSIPANEIVLNVTGVVRVTSSFNVLVHQNIGSNMTGVRLQNIYARRIG